MNTGDLNGNKSGGVNNFPRFAENWSGVAQLIQGSMVSLFRSEQGNARFVGSGYSGAFATARLDNVYATTACTYEAPDRKWGFDASLATDVTNLPPGTPRVVALDRIRWIRR